MIFRVARKAGYLTHTALIIAGRLLTPERVVRLLIGMFVAGIVWIFAVAAFLLPALFILYGLALMVPAVIVASLPLYGSSSK